MTTINDRITKLEDAFGRVIPLLEAIIETQNGHTGKLDEHTEKLDGHTGKLDGHTGKLDGHTGKLDGHTGKLEGHTEKLDAIIATQAEHTALLNQHSIKLELIKGYLG